MNINISLMIGTIDGKQMGKPAIGRVWVMKFSYKL
jgi:hypothetical protein